MAISSIHLDGFNRGDWARMSRSLDLEALQWCVVSSHKREQWITEIDALRGESVTASTGLDDEDKRELLLYFHRRHQQGDILRLLRFDLVPDTLDRDSMGVAYDLSREADDLLGCLPTGGKAIIDCRTGKIIRWVMDSDR